MYNILYIGYIYVMARVTPSAQALPSILAEQLATLGTNLRLARKRRRISRAAMAERMMVNPKTVDRMEKGDPALGIGIIATALWVLGMHRRLAELVAPQTDNIALQEDLKRLPRRISSSVPQADEFNF